MFAQLKKPWNCAYVHILKYSLLSFPNIGYLNSKAFGVRFVLCTSQDLAVSGQKEAYNEPLQTHLVVVRIPVLPCPAPRNTRGPQQCLPISLHCYLPHHPPTSAFFIYHISGTALGTRKITVIMSTDGALYSLHHFQIDVSLKILLHTVKILPSVVSYLRSVVYPVGL